MTDEDRANPRSISNALAAQSGSIPAKRNLSDFVWQWGQFLDHDIDLTHAGSEFGTAPIKVLNENDPLYPLIPLTRSEFDQNSSSPARQQINAITAWIDASNVYGSDQETADSLRTFEGGKLQTSANGLLLHTNENGSFLAGDVRVNEQVGLIAMHTLFVREHNRLADLIARQDRRLNDEQIYQLARKIVGAEMQIITYKEFLPALLGWYAPSPYGGRKYNPGCGPLD